MRNKLAAIFWLCIASAAVGQNPPDFSGVFLRVSAQVKSSKVIDTEPLVLEVKQSPDKVETTITQNGAISSTSYALNAPGTATKILGVPATSRAKSKNQDLLLESVILESVIKEPLTVPFGAKAVKISENWSLSEDRRTLTIVRKYEYPGSGAPDSDATEIYDRRNSLESALSDAAVETVQKCQTTTPAADNEKVFKLNEGAGFGHAWLDRLSAHVLFSTVISSDEFKEMERIRTKTGFEFRKKGQVVFEYPDLVVLEVEPEYSESKPWMMGQQPPVIYLSPSSKAPVPNEFLRLRFQLAARGRSDVLTRSGQQKKS